MKTTRIIATVAFAAIAILTTNAKAQTATTAQTATAQVIANENTQGSERVIQGQVETLVMPEGRVMPLPPAPKLGVTGQIVYGLGMRVLSVRYGSPAQRAGLEYGDIIVSANGMQIRHQGDLSRALRKAARFHNGSVNLLVKNIRGNYYYGNEYVTVNAQLFGPPIVTVGVPSNQVVEN